MDPFVIEEVNGLGRAIILRGNTRPFQPIELGIEQRMTTTHYSGNPVGFQRVNGAKFTDTTITGRWCDRRIGPDDRPVITGFGELLSVFATTAKPSQVQASAGPAGGSQAQNTGEIAAVMQSICAAGSRLRVSWHRHVRYGRMRSFMPRWKTRFECEWEIAFEWIGDQQDQPKAGLALPNVASFIDKLQAILEKILDLANAFAYIPTLALLQDAIGDLNAIAQEVIDDLRLVIDATLVPVDALGSVRSAYERLRVQAQQIVDDLEARTAGIDEATRRDATSLRLADQTAREIQRLVEVLMEESMLRQAEIDAALQGTVLATFVVLDWMSIRDVAIKFYGTSDSWPAIAQANNLPGSVVRPGTELKIPKLA